MLVIDGEFTGLDYDKHSIVSLGAFDFDNPDNRFYAECRIWEGAHIDEDALVVNGFSLAEVTDTKKMTEAELIESFLEWSEDLEDRTFVGQNVFVDLEMLRVATHRAGLNFPFAHRILDTHTICWTRMIRDSVEPPFDTEHHHSALNLSAVLDYCGIPKEPEPHNALTGALCHGEVASRLLFDQPLLPEFSEFPIPWLR